MARHGQLSEFTPATEDWRLHMEWLKQYFAANDVNDAVKQKAILLSVCGAETY